MTVICLLKASEGTGAIEMPTYDEDIVAAAAALRDIAGAEDDEEVQRFVVMFRALIAPREGATGGGGAANDDIPLLFVFPTDPLTPAGREMLQQALVRIEQLLARPPATP